MSYFSDTKHCGDWIMIAGLIMVIGLICSIILGIMNGLALDAAVIIGWIGVLIPAVILIGFAGKVRSGVISSKNDVLSKYVIISGAISVIGAILTLVAGFVSGVGMEVLGTSIGTAIVGIIIILIGMKMNAGFGGILRTLLVVVFFILLILNIIGIFAILGGLIAEGLACLANAMISLCALSMLNDPEVQKA